MGWRVQAGPGTVDRRVILPSISYYNELPGERKAKIWKIRTKYKSFFSEFTPDRSKFILFGVRDVGWCPVRVNF